MARIQKPRPNTLRETFDEVLGSQAADPTSGHPPMPVRNRGNDVSTAGDRDKDVSISIVDIDTAIIKYIEDKIKPNVLQDGKRLPVPVMYGYPERWQTIQEKGYLREYSGRMIAPVIVLKRDSMEANRNLGTKVDANNPQNFHVFESSYTKKNQYDNFAVLSNREPVKEFKIVVVPEYVTMTYSAVIFTNHLEQNNKIIEAFQYAANTYWGQEGRFQFRARIDSFSTSTEYSSGEDRTTRTTFTIILNGYIIPDTVNRDISYPKKFLSKAQVIFNLETDDSEIFISGGKTRKRKNNAGVVPTQPGGGGSSVNTLDLQYLAVNKPVEATAVTSNTATFGGQTVKQVPNGSSLPATSVNNFVFYAGSIPIPPGAITSFSGATNPVLTVNTTALGYDLTGLTITAIGKFE